MKKIYNLMMLMFLMIASVNGASLIYEQERVIADLKTSDTGFSVERYIIGLDNDQTIANYTGDIKYELRDISTSVYIMIQNPAINTTLNISWVNDDKISVGTNVSNIAYSQDLTMKEIGMYYFKFEPDYSGESVDIIFNIPDLEVSTMYMQETVPKGFSLVYETFISAINDLFAIIISLWKLFYYVIISAIILNVLFGMVSVVFKFIEMSEKIRDKKKKILRGDR